MAIALNDFECSPTMLPPEGGRVDFRFRARTSGEPTHMRARLWLASAEPFVFRLSGGSSRSLFFPAPDAAVEAPTSHTWFDVGEVSLGPEGGPDAGRTRPLIVNLELQGLDAAGQSVGGVRRRVVAITIATLPVALRASRLHLGLTQEQMSQHLSSSAENSVSPDVVGEVERGGSLSPNLQEALRRIFGA